jgi:RNA polymerase sigma-70 factor (ECF subfamily)
LIAKVKYSEEEMVALLQKADEKAFSVLYSNYSRALLGVVKKVIADETIAEDVLQEVFIKIWNNRASYDASKGRLYTWMLNIARNSSIDYLRSKQNRFDEKIQRGENSVHEFNRSNNTQQNTDAIGIKSIVSQLKDDHKVLIDLAYFEGYTQEEIAKELDIPLGTVKTRVRSALIALRKIIK